jgi:hypothetical protein
MRSRYSSQWKWRGLLRTVPARRRSSPSRASPEAAVAGREAARSSLRRCNTRLRPAGSPDPWRDSLPNTLRQTSGCAQPTSAFWVCMTGTIDPRARKSPTPSQAESTQHTSKRDVQRQVELLTRPPWRTAAARRRIPPPHSPHAADERDALEGARSPPLEVRYPEFVPSTPASRARVARRLPIRHGPRARGPGLHEPQPPCSERAGSPSSSRRGRASQPAAGILATGSQVSRGEPERARAGPALVTAVRGLGTPVRGLGA